MCHLLPRLRAGVPARPLGFHILIRRRFFAALGMTDTNRFVILNREAVKNLRPAGHTPSFGRYVASAIPYSAAQALLRMTMGQ